jgi:hypothetical protein
MIFKKSVKDLDLWINTGVRVILNSESCFYEGILLSEMKNGILIECSGKKIYIPYESLLALEEL